MVERPIKKSERQIAPPSDVVEQVPETEPSPTEGSQDSITESPQKRIITLPPVQGKDKTKGKGRGNQQDEDRSKFANPALMRGPKPTKSKPPLIKKSQEETETDEGTEADQEETAEG